MSAPGAAALRPLLPADRPRLAALFRASIRELAAEDYDEEQCDAWAGQADDETAFAARLDKALTLVVTVAGAPAAFASLAGPDVIDMLYVDPGQARRGLATMLLDALGRLAAARGATMLKVQASDTARPFFLARGFIPTVRNMVQVGGEWLGNTSMERQIPGSGAGRPS